MLYIGTTKTLQSQEVSMTDQDQFLVFCKETDTIKMSDFARLVKTGCIPTRCEMVKDRDDMLVLLGAYLGQTEEQVTLMDSTIPVPKRFSERITVPAAKTVTRRKRKKAEPATKKNEKEDIKENTKENTKAEVKADAKAEKKEPEERKQGTLEEVMPHPEAPEPPQAEEPEFEDPQAAALFRVLGLRSEDIGFSWPTEMLMLDLLSAVEQTRSDKDLESTILARRDGDKIWAAMKGHIAKIRQIADEN